MSRPPIDVNTTGKTTISQLDSGVFRAFTRYRDDDGKLRAVTARGPSGAAAERALKKKIAERKTPRSAGELKPTTRITALAEVWWGEFLKRDRSAATVKRYREVIDSYITPALGGLRIRECTIGVLTARIEAIRENHGPANAKHARTILRQMFALAATRDVIDNNPVAHVTLEKAKPKAVEALTVEQVRDLRGKLHDDVLVAFDVLMGTGARIGEVLALRWKDLDLGSTPPTIVISATIARGQDGLFRQEHTKTASSMQQLFVPAFTASRLREWRQSYIPPFAASTDWAKPDALVFPSTSGGVTDPSNFRKRWNIQVRAAGYDITPHVTRKTVATLLANSDNLAAASRQLGHSSESVTATHYVARLAVAPDATKWLDSLAD